MPNVFNVGMFSNAQFGREWSRMMWRHHCFFAVALRLRPVLIRASRVRPSTPPLFQSIERHSLEGQFDGSSVSGIHLCPHTSHTATRIVFQPMSSLYRILSYGHNTLTSRSETNIMSLVQTMNAR